MLLYLLRHGIAIDREDPECPPDAERWLTKEGVEKTRQVARGLKRLGLHPGLILASPLVRAMQTAEIAARELGYPKEKIQSTRELLPEADPAGLLKELSRLKQGDVLCAGHAPHLDELIAHAVGARSGLTSLKKAGAACLEFDAFAASRGKLIWILPPKILRFLGE
jgi:phosphohistidine phosphatase